MTEAMHYHIRGRVQGVGFRHFVHDRATRLGIFGWVKNLPDGSVQVRAEGSPERLAALETHLREGPRFGRVDQLDSLAVEAEHLTTFEIRH